MIARTEYLALPPEARAGGSRHVGIVPFERLAARLLAIGPLAALLALQTVASLTLRNTAFQDEALYLYAGRQIVDSLRGGLAVTEAYATYFSGLPTLYPVVAGLLDSLWGLEAARLLSLICMLAATTAAYIVGRELFDRDSGLVGAALFAVQGSVLFLSRLATYDALSLALVGLAMVFAARAGASRRLIAAVLVAVCLALGVTTKYVGLLFVPSVLAVLGWQSVQTCGWKRAVAHLGVSAAVLGLCLGLVVTANPDVRTGLQVTTTARTLTDAVSRLSLVGQATMQGGLVLGLGLLGLGLAWTRSRARVTALVLFGSALLPLVYHISAAEFISFHKHIAFGLLFAAPLAGYALAHMAGYARGRLIGERWPAALALCLLAFGLGLPQAQALYAAWPASDAVVHVLRTQVRPGSTQILAEESEIPRYYLQDVVEPSQWHNLDWFQYTDADGRVLTGPGAYTAAINDGYFDLVVLRYGWNAELTHAIDGGLLDGLRYELLTQIPYDVASGSGTYWVWRKRVD